ncbi:ferritin [Candidatus Dojkabacteria bacterium]|nr:ferritin [Candidatus Dojkabacteria bacterium]
MGTKGAELVNLDLDKLFEKLNKALADEWLAYYQYWVGAKVAEGRMRGFVAEELNEHAQEELEHANMLVERITQLGGTPILNPSEWMDKTNCGYEEPSDFNTKKLLQQNIKGEQCAIKVYKELLEFVRGKDDITFRMLLEILEDEVEHEDELENILADMVPVK